jgi:hypothetical protein
MAWGAVDDWDDQISIQVFDAYIRCLNVIRFIFGEFVMFHVFLIIFAEPAWAFPSGWFVAFMV